MNPGDLIAYHHWLLSDEGRTRGYEEAIRQVVRPGDVVVDIGTGTGILAFLACQAGARKVFAIEEGPIIEVASSLARANGMSDRIVFLRGSSQALTLPEKADVLISDTGGNFGLAGGILGTVIDARQRLLKPDCRIIPRTLELFVAPAECPTAYALIGDWTTDICGFDFSAVRTIAAGNYYQPTIVASCLLSQAPVLARIPIADVETPYLRANARCEISKAGVIHGIAGWQTMELAPGVTRTNFPFAPSLDWSCGFFPLERPVAVIEGDRVIVDFGTHDGGDWHWRGEVLNRSGECKLKFSHSTLQALPIRKRMFHPSGPEQASGLSRLGEAELFLLNQLQKRLPEALIRDQLLDRYPDCFPNSSAAWNFLDEVAARCSAGRLSDPAVSLSVRRTT